MASCDMRPTPSEIVPVVAPNSISSTKTMDLHDSSALKIRVGKKTFDIYLFRDSLVGAQLSSIDTFIHHHLQSIDIKRVLVLNDASRNKDTKNFMQLMDVFKRYDIKAFEGLTR